MAVYEASWHGPKIFYRFTGIGNESWGCGGDPSDSPRKSILLSPWIGRCRTKVDVLSSWSPPRGFDSSICDWKNKFSLFGKYHLFRIESFRVDFRCVHRFQLLKVCDQYVTLNHSPRTMRIRGTIQVKLSFPNWWMRDWSFAVFGWYSFNEPNGIIGPLNGFPKRPLVWCLPIRWEICDISQISVNIPLNLPTNFRSGLMATILQTYLLLLCALLFQQSHLFPICVVSTCNDSSNHQNFLSRSTAPPMRLLHGALVILVLWQISHFRSLGKWV